MILALYSEPMELAKFVWHPSPEIGNRESLGRKAKKVVDVSDGAAVNV